MADRFPDDAPFEGTWWDPDAPERRVGGRLTLDGQFWRLTLFGWLGHWEYGVTEEPPRVVHGDVGGEPFTLTGVVLNRWTMAGHAEPSETVLSANVVLSGRHLAEDSTFSSATVRVLNLDEWSNRNPWKFDQNGERVTFVDPGDLVAVLPGATATLWRGRGRSGGFSRVTLTSHENVILSFNNPVSLSEVEHGYVRPLVGLIELAAGERSDVISLTLNPHGADPHDRVTVLSAASRGPIGDPVHPHFFVFTRSDIDYATLLPAWWSMYDDLGVVLDLARVPQSPWILSNQFLNAATALEGYHRHRTGKVKPTSDHEERVRRLVAVVPNEDQAWLRDQLAFSHEPSFASRVDDLVVRAGSRFSKVVGDTTAWRNWVKQGRNAVAHRDPGMLDLEKEWSTAVPVTMSMQWLLRLTLLDDLCVPDAVIDAKESPRRQLAYTAERLKVVQPGWFQ